MPISKRRIIQLIGLGLIIGGIICLVSAITIFFNHFEDPFDMPIGTVFPLFIAGGFMIVGGFYISYFGYTYSSPEDKRSTISPNNPYSVKTIKKKEEKKETSICQYCGNSISENNKICPNCGSEQK